MNAEGSSTGIEAENPTIETQRLCSTKPSDSPLSTCAAKFKILNWGQKKLHQKAQQVKNHPRQGQEADWSVITFPVALASASMSTGGWAHSVAHWAPLHARLFKAAK